MSEALSLTGFKPTAIGLDYFYLIDGADTYFRTGTISDMVEMIEQDAPYRDEPGRMDNARIYLLAHGRAPISVRVEYSSYARDEVYTYKIMRIYNQTGDMLSQHGYEIPNS